MQTCQLQEWVQEGSGMSLLARCPALKPILRISIELFPQTRFHLSNWLRLSVQTMHARNASPPRPTAASSQGAFSFEKEVPDGSRPPHVSRHRRRVCRGSPPSQSPLYLTGSPLVSLLTSRGGTDTSCRLERDRPRAVDTYVSQAGGK